MSTKAMLSFTAASAVLLLAACAQQPPPPLSVAAPPRPTARRAPPPRQLQPRVQQASQPEPVRAERVVPDQGVQRNCAYQGAVVQDHATDEDPSALGLNSVLAGQSARDACLRAHQRNTRPSGAMP